MEDTQKLSLLFDFGSLSAGRALLSTASSEQIPVHFTDVEEAFFASEVEPIDACDERRLPLGERVRDWFCEVMARVRRSPVLG
jgi:hypothetical protein